MGTAILFEKRVAYQKSMDLNHLVIEICKRIHTDQQYLAKELSISSMELMRYLAIHYSTDDMSISKQAGTNALTALTKAMNALVITHQYGWLDDDEKGVVEQIYTKIKSGL